MAQMSGWMMSAPADVEQAQELEAAVEALAGGQRAFQLRLERAPGLDVLGPQRLLEEHRVVGSQRVAQLHRLPGLEDFRVRIEGEVEMRRAGLPQTFEILAALAHHLAPAPVVQPAAERAHLEGGEAPLLLQRQALVAGILWIRGGIDAEIDLHLVARMAAEQHVDRDVQRLGRDVPQGMVDGRDGGEAQRTRREALQLQQLQDQELDAPRILALDLHIEIVEQRRQGLVRPMVVALAPAGDALVGVDGDDDPRPVAVAGHEAPQSGDAQSLSSL